MFHSDDFELRQTGGINDIRPFDDGILIKFAIGFELFSLVRSGFDVLVERSEIVFHRAADVVVDPRIRS
jgi:hypothetical protein